MNVGTKENDVVAGSANSIYAAGAGEGPEHKQGSEKIKPRQEGQATIRTAEEVSKSPASSLEKEKPDPRENSF